MSHGWTQACERQATNLQRYADSHPEIADWLLTCQDNWAANMRRAVRQWGQMTPNQLRASLRAAKGYQKPAEPNLGQMFDMAYEDQCRDACGL